MKLEDLRSELKDEHIPFRKCVRCDNEADVIATMRPLPNEPKGNNRFQTFLCQGCSEDEEWDAFEFEPIEDWFRRKGLMRRGKRPDSELPIKCVECDRLRPKKGAIRLPDEEWGHGRVTFENKSEPRFMCNDCATAPFRRNQ